MSKKQLQFLAVILFIGLVKCASNEETSALSDIFFQCCGLEWTSSNNWLVGDPCANNWYGVGCSAMGQVVTLSLPNNQVCGTLTTSISKLSHLESLSLDTNRLAGLTGELWNIPNLKNVTISNNFMSMAIPTTINNSSSLELINFGGNQLFGGIPEAVFGLANLTTLYLNDNNLVGTISESIGQLTQLRRFVINNNQITGELPNSINNLTKLAVLNIEDNSFTGSLPDISSLAELQILMLSNNQFSGPLPDLMSLLKLTYLELFNNQFSGTLSNPLLNTTRILAIDMKGNLFSGSIPSDFYEAQFLRALDLSNNQFSGELQPFLSQQFNSINLSNNQFTGILDNIFLYPTPISKFILSNNQFSGSIPDWIASNSSVLTYLDVSYNAFSGSLPSADTFKYIQQFLINNNSFQQSLDSIFSLFIGVEPLVTLSLNNNLLSGTIGETINDLGGTNLYFVNISNNQISGDLPESVDFDFTVDISGNNFTCPFPETWNANSYVTCVSNCCEITQQVTGASSQADNNGLIIGLSVAGGALLLLVVVIVIVVSVYYARRSKQKYVILEDEFHGQESSEE